MPKMVAMAVAWFREEDWQRWRAVDPNFQPDYERWRRRIEAAIKDLVEGRGVLVEKVTIDPDEFVEWCRVNGCKVDSKGRVAYAAQTVAERYSATCH